VFLQLSALQIPYFLSVILPITTFVVVLFLYQRLAGDRELTVMRAAGLSSLALARPALALALLATGLGYGLNLWLVPLSSAAFRQYQFEIRNRVAAFLLQEGVFTQVSNALTVYVRAREPDGLLRGILIEDARQPNNPATILAESGRLIGSGPVPRVLLYNGSREELDRQTGRLDVLTFAENTIDLTQEAPEGIPRLRDINEMSLHELLYPRPGSVLPRDLPKLRVEAFRRFASPLTTLSFTLVALLAVLHGGFRRHGGVLRPLAAVLSVVGLLALGLLVENLAAKSPPLLPLIWVVAMAPGLVCGWVLFAGELLPLPAARPAGAGAG
jgi:lipopolysaccharide export system permease protein